MLGVRSIHRSPLLSSFDNSRGTPWVANVKVQVSGHFRLWGSLPYSPFHPRTQTQGVGRTDTFLGHPVSCPLDPVVINGSRSLLDVSCPPSTLLTSFVGDFASQTSVVRTPGVPKGGPSGSLVLASPSRVHIVSSRVTVKETLCQSLACLPRVSADPRRTSTRGERSHPTPQSRKLLATPLTPFPFAGGRVSERTLFTQPSWSTNPRRPSSTSSVP